MKKYIFTFLLFLGFGFKAYSYSWPSEAAKALVGDNLPPVGTAFIVTIRSSAEQTEFNGTNYDSTIECVIQVNGSIVGGCYAGGYTTSHINLPINGPSKTTLTGIKTYIIRNESDKCVNGSVIKYSDKSVSEQIPVDGTDFYLNYASAFNEKIEKNRIIKMESPRYRDSSFPNFALAELTSVGQGGPTQKVCTGSSSDPNCVHRSGYDKNLINALWDGTSANQSSNIFVSRLNYSVAFENYSGGLAGYTLPGGVDLELCNLQQYFDEQLLPLAGSTTHGNVQIRYGYVDPVTAQSASPEFISCNRPGIPFPDYTSTYPIANVNSSLTLYHPAVWGLKGWTVSSHHYLDINSKTLFMGSGTKAQYQDIKHYFSTEYNQEVYYIPNQNSSYEYFIFNGQGQHLETRSLLKTAKPLQKFYYDTDFKLIKIENLYGKLTKFIYDQNNQITKIIAPYGQETNIVADQNHILSVTNSLSQNYELTYDNSDLLLTFKSISGVITNFVYDSSGALLQESKNNGLLQILQNTLTEDSDIFQIVANWGVKLKTIVTFNLNFDEVTTRQNNSGQTFVTEIHTKNYTLLNSENKSHVESTTTHPFWGVDLPLTYEITEKHLDSSTAAGFSILATTTIGYAENITTSDEGFPKAQIIGTAIGYPATSGNSELNIFTNIGGTYRLQSRDITSTDIVETYFNQNMQPTQISAPRRSTLNFSYNDIGQLIRVQKNSTYEDYTYDQFGFLATSTNSKAQVTSYLRDSQGKVLTKTLPNGDTTKFEYTAAGEIKKITTPSNQIHNFRMDLGDYISQYLNADQKNTQFNYDSDKRLTGIIKPSQKTINYNYNSTTGALDSIFTSGGNYLFTNQDTQYRPHTITSPDGIKMDFNYTGDLVKETKWYDEDGSIIGTLSYSFRSNSLKVDSVQLNGSTKATFDYDTYGRLAIIKPIVFSNTGPGPSANYSYRDDQIYVNTAEMYTKAYNLETSEGNTQLLNTATLNSISGQTFITLSRTFDHFGQATDYSQTSQNMVSGVYNSFTIQAPQYDQNNRLIQTQRNRKTYLNSQLTDSTDFQNNYSYPPNSNNNMAEFTQIINNQNLPSRRTTASFAPDDKLLSLHGSINRDYTYTDDGEVKTMTNCYGTTTYEYDVFGSLKKMTLPDGKTIEYKIDGMNRRVKKIVNGVAAEYYLWYDQTHLAYILDANKVVKLAYYYGSDSSSPSLVVKGNTTYKTVADPGLGSIRFVIEPVSRQIVQEIEYDEYGNILNNTNPEFQPVLYAGGLYDSDTKLIRFGARDYDPTIGRWTTKDPIGFAGGDTNLYAYVGGNPMSYSDPRGLKVNDFTGGKIPTEIVNSPIYRQLDSMSQVINIGLDENLDAAGLTTFLSPTAQNVSINPNNQLSHSDLLDTYVHELNHALINFSHGNTGEFYDTNILLPDQIRRNLKGARSCPPK